MTSSADATFDYANYTQITKQGRIQDSKFGVAQMHWKNWKKKSGGIISIITNIIAIIVYIWNTMYFKYAFFITILYIFSPLIQYCNKKSYLEKFKGRRRPGAPPSKSALAKHFSDESLPNHNILNMSYWADNIIMFDEIFRANATLHLLWVNIYIISIMLDRFRRLELIRHLVNFAPNLLSLEI